MHTLKSYLGGSWISGGADPSTLVNPATEEPIAQALGGGLDLEQGLAFARQRGGRALGDLSLVERGKLLSSVARIMHEHRDELLDMAMVNGGNTRGDAKFDVDGASGTLAYYAAVATELGDARLILDGDTVQLGRSPRLVGRHIWAARRGVAVLINAFNFPAWGFGEKAACALLAGMPVLLKPATSTALVAHRIVELVAPALPPGVVSMVVGPAYDLPGLLDYGDVIAFTGSSHTARSLMSLPRVQSHAVRLNVEADSLNAAVLGADVEAGSETYELFVRDVVREMTQKTGQKCTAVRRILVGRSHFERVRDDLAERLAAVAYGDPRAEGVRMGPVATAQQLRDVESGIGVLSEQATVVTGGLSCKPAPATEGKGYFVAPTLLASDDPGVRAVHELEVFGPVATLLAVPDDAETISEILGRGRGGLVASLYTDDRKIAAELLVAAAPHHGRLVFGSHKIADQSISPGTAMPQLLHGGPGRAGGGEELGGLRGIALYSQRTAIQGDRALLDAITAKG